MAGNGSAQIVQKLWNYCNVLRDDGLSYGDYVEQLTFLLFLKMAYERTRPPWNRPSVVPIGFDWPSLVNRDGDVLETHYRHVLEKLGTMPGTLGTIFRKAQNKIQDPAKLRRLIADLIDREQWTMLDADVKGDAYEGLLQKNAEDVKSGAGRRRDAGAPTLTRSWSSGIRSAWTSSGSGTRAWKTAPTSRTRTCWRPRSPRTSRPPWTSSPRSPRISEAATGLPSPRFQPSP